MSDRVPVREYVERLAAERRNHERARLFGAPVLRSRHPDALLFGYSIFGENHPPRRPYDRVVEGNHISLSSYGTDEPVGFSTRSYKECRNPASEFRIHAIYDLTNSIPSRVTRPSTRESRLELDRRLEELPRREARVSIDDEVRVGYEVEFRGSVFVSLPGFGGAELITIAAPRKFVDAGFWSDVPA